MNSIQDIIDLIAHRDNISILEATNLVEDCIDALYDANNYFDCEDILADWLGLEPDYLDILIGG